MMTNVKRLSCPSCEPVSVQHGFMVNPSTLNPERDDSVFACPDCFKSLSKDEEQGLREWDSVWCQCGRDIWIEDKDISLMVLPSSSPLLYKDEVKQRTWFHTTTVPDWLSIVTGIEAYVHLGSFEAAMERATDKDFNLKRKNAGQCFRWELALRPETMVADGVMQDDNQWLKYVTDCSRKHLGGDVQRYLNKYESAGSISLLADPRMVEVVRVTEITDMDCEPFRSRASVKSFVGA